MSQHPYKAAQSLLNEFFPSTDGPMKFEDFESPVLAHVLAKTLVENSNFTAEFLTALAHQIHSANCKAGWWNNPHTGEDLLETRNRPEMLMLIVSEVSEAMEAYRKNLNDDKLPQRPGFQTEIADAFIRIMDLMGAEQRMSPDHLFGEIVQEKREFNRTREDHKPENRVKPGGKAF